VKGAGIVKARRARGFTLIEMVIFMVIAGIAGVALLQMFSRTMPGSPAPAQLTQATQLAQERMELILGRRDAVGYGALNDPCVGGTPPAICTNVFGYTVTVNGVSSAVAWNGNPTTDFKLISVTVSLNGRTLAQSDAVVANY
jgi:prepilin-type N-terminal cleavage/methylation domain-containing protein